MQDSLRLAAVGFATAAMIGCAGTALAADVYTHGGMKDAPVEYIPPISWSGFYLGVNAGYAWGSTDWTFPVADASVSPDVNGGIYGAQIGYNYQIDNWVLGAEVSFNGSGADGSAICPNDAFTCKSDHEWLLLAGPRLGYARDRWLGYVSGGYALASIKTTANPAFANFNDSQDHSGWAIGGGLEYLISSNVVFGVEYMHVDFGSETHAGSPFDAGVTRDVDGNLNIVRARLSYKFDCSDAPLK
ncbi:MAG: outer membrane protein [Rhodomicrobiaceae bacterium]